MTCAYPRDRSTEEEASEAALPVLAATSHSAIMPGAVQSYVRSAWMYVIVGTGRSKEHSTRLGHLRMPHPQARVVMPLCSMLRTSIVGTILYATYILVVCCTIILQSVG